MCINKGSSEVVLSRSLKWRRLEIILGSIVQNIEVVVSLELRLVLLEITALGSVSHLRRINDPCIVS